MSSVSGFFDSDKEAGTAIQSLKSHGIHDAQINLLTRGNSSTLTASTLVPGLGPVTGAGRIAGELIRSALGAAAGAAVDRNTHGVPNEDLYAMETTIREGGAVVIVDARDSTQETQARNLIERSGGRAGQVARRDWWQRRRDHERDFLRSRGHDLEPIENDYRSGFEAALHPTTRGRDYDQVVAYVETCYPGPCRTAAFKIGYDRGQHFFRESMQARELE